MHLMKNFVKRFQGSVFGRMYPAARTFQPEYHEYLMNKMYAANKKVKPFLEQHHNLLWMRSKFKEQIKCDHITNKGNKPRSKGMWQVQCKTCLAFGHRQSSPKCPCNGPKKRKSRAKQGRPLGSGKAAASTSRNKRQKVQMHEDEGNTTPGTSQMHSNMEGRAMSS